MEPSAIVFQACFFLFALLVIITAGYFLKRFVGAKDTTKVHPILPMKEVTENEKFLPQVKPQYSLLGKAK